METAYTYNKWQLKWEPTQGYRFVCLVSAAYPSMRRFLLLKWCYGNPVKQQNPELTCRSYFIMRSRWMPCTTDAWWNFLVTPRNFSSSFLLRWSSILASTILVAKFSEYYVKQNMRTLYIIWQPSENTAGTWLLWVQASGHLYHYKIGWEEGRCLT